MVQVHSPIRIPAYELKHNGCITYNSDRNKNLSISKQTLIFKGIALFNCTLQRMNTNKCVYKEGPYKVCKLLYYKNFRAGRSYNMLRIV